MVRACVQGASGPREELASPDDLRATDVHIATFFPPRMRAWGASERRLPMPISHILRSTSIDQLRRRAKELLRAYRAGEVQAVADFKEFHHGPPSAESAQLSDAQLVMARRHDFPSWPRFKQGIELFNAICADDPARVFAIFERHPHLRFERVTGVNSNWGPPLTCAAQVNAKKVVTALLEQGGQNLRSALSRAALHGRIRMVQEMMRAGAEIPLGAAMGPCE